MRYEEYGTLRIEIRDAIKRIEHIKAAIFDGDGVLTDNRVLEGLEDVKPRFRSHYDGQGISLLRAIGIRVCFITNESGVSAAYIRGLVERWNNLPSASEWGEVELFEGKAGKDKVLAAGEWLKKHNIDWSVCGMMGDDLVDWPLLLSAGFTAAPSSAEKVILDSVHFISRRPGGSGAIRDFANLILEVRGVDQRYLPTQ